jgi:hypothetical protein
LSTPFINVTLGGSERSEDVVESIMDKIARAAALATESACEFHVDKAKRNVQYAYTAAVQYAKISFMYASWLVEFDAEQTGEILSEEDVATKAKELQENKQSLIFSGAMLDGISYAPVTDTGDEIRYLLVSSAPYSDDIEKGLLFGKHRPGKERPFFTGHYWETEWELKKAFHKFLSEVIL